MPDDQGTSNEINNNSTSVDIVYGLQPDCNTVNETAFNICLDLTSPTGVLEPWFTHIVQAKKRWERIITKDPWPTWSGPEVGFAMMGHIGTNVPFFGVDDIYVSIEVVDYLDGPGKKQN